MVFASIFDHESKPSVTNPLRPVLVIIDAKHTLSHFVPFHTVIKGSFFCLSLELPMDKDSPASQQLYLEVFLWSVEDSNLCNLEATVPRDVLSGSLLH